MVGEGVDVVLKADPGDDCGGEGEVEETFVGDGKDDEDGGEGKEDYEEAVEVVGVCLKAVKEGDGKGGNCGRLISVQRCSHGRRSVLRTNQPTNWFPTGSPFLA